MLSGASLMVSVVLGSTMGPSSVTLVLVCIPFQGDELIVSLVGYVLQEQYWVHCEFFPHRVVPQNLKRQLVDIFRQGRAG